MVLGTQLELETDLEAYLEAISDARDTLLQIVQ